MEQIGFWSENPEIGLQEVREQADLSFSSTEEYRAVVWFLNNPTDRVSYRGFSRCRVCGTPNGSQDYMRSGFRWPSGYLHYVTEHHVRPPAQLIETAVQQYGEAGSPQV